MTLKDLSLGKPIAKGANAVVYAAQIKSAQQDSVNQIKTEEVKTDKYPIANYPFAVKMMFNYDIQSNAMAILKAMYRETVPARLYYSNVGIADWEIK